MSKKLNLRVRGQNGKSGVIRGVDACESLEKLISHSIDCLGLDNQNTQIVKILTGYPPKPLDLSDPDRSIEQLGINSGDNLLLETRTSEPTKESSFVFGAPNTLNRSDSSKENSAPSESCKNSAPPQDNSDSSVKRLKSSNSDSAPDGKLARKVIPADNSCLFTAVNFCMSGEVVDSKHSYFMREVISSAVSNDKEKYSEAILGRENSNYCDWIKKTDTWGGAIEVQILSEYFQVEIVVADTKSGSLTRFGEGYNFDNRMSLIYDGIHYDALYQKFNSGRDRTIFPSSQSSLMEEIKIFAEEAKSAHKFTDVAGFTLKCLVCQTRLKGATEAQAHAKETDHQNFAEYHD